MDVSLPPLRMNRILVEKTWGGRRLSDVPGIALPEGKAIGESWELADHDAGMSVTTWPEKRTLRAWMTACEREILGRARSSAQGRFPLLCKFLDASEPLSVQVHPDDAYASHHEGDWGKTEAWYILDAAPDAWVIAGFREGVTREQLRDACASEAIADLLVKHPVASGDTVFLPAGTVHTIGPGIVLAEVQQSSDVTYRFYDWGRTGRELHTERGLEVSVLETHEGPRKAASISPGEQRSLVRCSAFELVEGAGSLPTAPLDACPMVIMVLAGEGELRWPGGTLALERADTVLVPACVSEISIDASPQARFLRAQPTAAS